MNVKFQLLQVDDLSLLSWAKAQSMRAIEGGNKSFSKFWNVNGIEITARAVEVSSDDIVVKLRFINESSPYYHTYLIDNPCECRAVSILYNDPLTLKQTSVVTFAGIDTAGHSYNKEIRTIEVFDADGVVIQTVTGTLIGPYDTNPTGGGGAAFFITDYNNYPSLGDAPTYPPEGGPIIGVRIYVTNGSWNANQLASVHSTAAYSGESAKWEVVLSDGEVLVDWDADYRFNTQNPKPVSTIWSGGGYVDLEDDTRITFDVPDDVCGPEKPDTPPGVSFSYEDDNSVPNTTIRTVTITGPNVETTIVGSSSFVGGVFTLINFYDDFFGIVPAIRNGTFSDAFVGTSTLIEDTDEYAAASENPDWIAARKLATARERARLKACSDSFIANLAAGEFDGVYLAARAGPLSNHVLMPTLMTANVVDGQSGAGDDILFTKVVTLSFKYVDEDGVEQTVTEVVNGTKHVVITRPLDPAGNPTTANFTTTTYVSWLPIDSNGRTVPLIDFQYVSDLMTGLSQIHNGEVISARTASGATVTSITQTLASVSGHAYVPPLPMPSDTRTATYPAIYANYRERIKATYNKDNPYDAVTRSWLDTAFFDGEVIDVIPITTIHPTFGDLGMFPQTDDLGADGVYHYRATRIFTFKYDYQLGKFTLTTTKRALNEDDEETYIEFEAFEFDSANVLFITRSARYPDVNEAYKLQAARLLLKPEDVPEDDPLILGEKLAKEFKVLKANFQ